MPSAPLLMTPILTGIPSTEAVISSCSVIWKQPSPPMAILTGMPSVAAVIISCSVIWKQPSPSMAHTVSSGMPVWAPMAAGTANPIVPRPPELIHVRGFVKGQNCEAHI